MLSVCFSQSQNDAEHAQALIAKADPARFPLQTADQPETVLNLQLNKVDVKTSGEWRC